MRLIVGICLLFLIFSAPWWWVTVLLVVAIFLFRGYPEAYIIFSMLIIRSYPHMQFGDRMLWLGLIFLVWAALAFAAGQLQYGRDSALYV